MLLSPIRLLRSSLVLIDDYIIRQEFIDNSTLSMGNYLFEALELFALNFLFFIIMIVLLLFLELILPL